MDLFWCGFSGRDERNSFPAVSRKWVDGYIQTVKGYYSNLLEAMVLNVYIRFPRILHTDVTLQQQCVSRECFLVAWFEIRKNCCSLNPRIVIYTWRTFSIMAWVRIGSFWLYQLAMLFFCAEYFVPDTTLAIHAPKINTLTWKNNKSHWMLSGEC